MASMAATATGFGTSVTTPSTRSESLAWRTFAMPIAVASSHQRDRSVSMITLGPDHGSSTPPPMALGGGLGVSVNDVPSLAESDPALHETSINNDASTPPTPMTLRARGATGSGAASRPRRRAARTVDPLRRGQTYWPAPVRVFVGPTGESPALDQGREDVRAVVLVRAAEAREGRPEALDGRSVARRERGGLLAGG